MGSAQYKRSSTLGIIREPARQRCWQGLAVMLGSGSSGEIGLVHARERHSVLASVPKESDVRHLAVGRCYGSAGSAYLPACRARCSPTL